MIQEKRKSVQSIQRALSILRSISNYDENGLRLSVIARKANLHVATTQRIIQTLVKEKYVKCDPVTKLYFLGQEVYSLINDKKYVLIRNKYNSLNDKIAKITEDTTYVVVRLGLDSLCIDRIHGNHTIQVVHDIGTRVPLGCGGGGIAILSVMPDNEVEEVLKANERRLWHHNKLSLDKVRKTIKVSRKMGFAFSEGLYMKNINAVGVPIREDDLIGAICVTSISDRTTRKRSKEIAEIIMAEMRKTGTDFAA